MSEALPAPSFPVPEGPAARGCTAGRRPSQTLSLAGLGTVPGLLDGRAGNRVAKAVREREMPVRRVEENNGRASLLRGSCFQVRGAGAAAEGAGPGASKWTARGSASPVRGAAGGLRLPAGLRRCNAPEV